MNPRALAKMVSGPPSFAQVSPLVRRLGEAGDGGVVDQSASRLSWLGLLALAGGCFWLGRQSIGIQDKAKSHVKRKIKAAVGWED